MSARTSKRTNERHQRSTNTQGPPSRYLCLDKTNEPPTLRSRAVSVATALKKIHLGSIITILVMQVVGTGALVVGSMRVRFYVFLPVGICVRQIRGEGVRGEALRESERVWGRGFTIATWFLESFRLGRALLTSIDKYFPEDPSFLIHNLSNFIICGQTPVPPTKTRGSAFGRAAPFVVSCVI